MPYMNGKVDMAGYGASTKTMGSAMKESYKKGLAKMKAKKRKPIGSRVQGPDAQYATGTMGKQPIKVYARPDNMGQMPKRYRETPKSSGPSGPIRL